MSDEDEFTPRERGLLAGRDWARLAFRTDDPDAMLGDPRMVARTAEIPEPLRAFVISHPDLSERLAASVEPNAEAAFWRGFVHGVRAFIVEIEAGTGSN